PDLFFADDGVLQLIKTQQAALIAQKNIASVLKSLPLFEINNIYVCNKSLAERNITVDNLILTPYCFAQQELPGLLKHYAVILTF
ncbi:MAG: DsrE family protein, partial [Endozoicomonadaceae bacterium]|nr:DsrE family protein [Endozoicomonadaceae bacterium]